MQRLSHWRKQTHLGPRNSMVCEEVMSEFTLICAADSIIERTEYPVLRFTRVGDTIDIFMNGIKINILDEDEWRWMLNAMRRL
jgi:hypothetical protein